MIGVVIRDGGRAKQASIINGFALMKPEPVLFKCPDERLDVTVLFGGIEANPLTQNAARGEGIEIEPAGGLASVVHAEDEIMTADTIGEFGVQHQVERLKPFDGSTPEICMPADDAPGEDVHDYDEEHLLADGELKGSHIGCPELIDPRGSHAGNGTLMNAFLDPRTKQVVGTHDTGGSFPAYGNTVLFPDECSDAPDTPRRMLCLHHMNGVNKVVLVGTRRTQVRNGFRHGTACMEGLMGYSKNLRLVSVRDTCIHHMLDHKPINPSFFLNACMAIA